MCRPKKLLYSSTDENFKPVVHELYDSTHRMDKICRYDLDELDTTWLAQYNRLREEAGLNHIRLQVPQKSTPPNSVH